MNFPLGSLLKSFTDSLCATTAPPRLLFQSDDGNKESCRHFAFFWIDLFLIMGHVDILYSATHYCTIIEKSVNFKTGWDFSFLLFHVNYHRAVFPVCFLLIWDFYCLIFIFYFLVLGKKEKMYSMTRSDFHVDIFFPFEISFMLIYEATDSTKQIVSH